MPSKKEIDPVKRLEIIQNMQRAFLDHPVQIPLNNSFTHKGLIREWVLTYPLGNSSRSNWYAFDKVQLDVRAS